MLMEKERGSERKWKHRGDKLESERGKEGLEVGDWGMGEWRINRWKYYNQTASLTVQSYNDKSISCE